LQIIIPRKPTPLKVLNNLLFGQQQRAGGQLINMALTLNVADKDCACHSMGFFFNTRYVSSDKLVSSDV